MIIANAFYMLTLMTIDINTRVNVRDKSMHTLTALEVLLTADLNETQRVHRERQTQRNYEYGRVSAIWA